MKIHIPHYYLNEVRPEFFKAVQEFLMQPHSWDSTSSILVKINENNGQVFIGWYDELSNSLKSETFPLTMNLYFFWENTTDDGFLPEQFSVDVLTMLDEIKQKFPHIHWFYQKSDGSAKPL